MGGGGLTVDAGSKPTYLEKLRVPLPPPWECVITADKLVAILESNR